jgi:uncharacterized membrane protein YdfJ with MMPL/SSD domain
MSYNRTICLLTLKSQNLIGYTDHSLYAESHDGVNDIVIVLPESLDGLLAGNACLCHNELDVLGLKAILVNLLTIILLFLFLLIILGSLALAENLLLVVVTGVVTGSLGGSELLGSGSLGLGVQVLNLGLTEDAKRGN